NIWLRGFFSAHIFSLADYYLAPSPALMKAYRKSALRPERLLYLPNGVDTERFRPADAKEKRLLRSRLGLPTDELLIMFTGHFSSDKRPHLLAEAWSMLETTGVSLILVGSTSETGFEVSRDIVARVRETAQGKNLPGRLITIERTGTIEDYYRAADIFVLPSVREGMPNALLEAMASGLACIATRLEGITDILLQDKSHGVLFEADDREALVTALNELVCDHNLRWEQGSNARQTVCALYDLRTTARRYRELLFNACRA
ncbi:MAG: glycosyltransferase family 4 protein, partial [Gemmatimonadota bacterium]|nr:glycosyltransferase family 4 protein [Gemmatimonadota bacterium]